MRLPILHSPPVSLRFCIYFILGYDGFAFILYRSRVHYCVLKQKLPIGIPSKFPKLKNFFIFKSYKVSLVDIFLSRTTMRFLFLFLVVVVFFFVFLHWTYFFNAWFRCSMKEASIKHLLGLIYFSLSLYLLNHTKY